jgi:hypothetical protein
MRINLISDKDIFATIATAIATTINDGDDDDDNVCFPLLAYIYV